MNETAVTLTRRQLDELARGVAQSVIASMAVGRASFTVAEVAARNGFGTDHVYRAIRAGLLVAVRPGDGTEMRITPEAEQLWVMGKRDAADKPALGAHPKVSERTGRKRRGT